MIDIFIKLVNRSIMIMLKAIIKFSFFYLRAEIIFYTM